MDPKITNEECVSVDRVRLAALIGASLVHDINNALAVILANVDVMQTSGATPPDFAGPLDDIRLVVDHVVALTSELLRFERADAGDGSASLVDLKAVVERSRPLLRAALASSVDLVVDTGEDPALIHGADVRIQQILWNLVTNAGQAIHDGGCVRIRVDRSAHDHVRLRVEDSGEGLRESSTKAVFESGFSTRRGQGGHGLGLRCVRALAERDGARVSFRSQPGEGTTFEVVWNAACESGVHRTLSGTGESRGPAITESRHPRPPRWRNRRGRSASR